MSKEGLSITDRENLVSIKKLVKKGRLTEEEIDLMLSSVDKTEFFEKLIHELKYKHLATDKEIVDMFSSKPSEKSYDLPVSIFNNKELSALETITKYLKENLELRYTDIAKLLNRDQRTIWVTYNNSKKKRQDSLNVEQSEYVVPLSIFSDRNLSVLENLVSYLKDNYNLRYVEIAGLLNRDERNVWGVYNKAKKKA